MTKRFMNPKGKLLVAVNLDEHAGPILQAAGALAQRTGLSLDVIHVSEYWIGRTWPTDMMMGGPMGGLVGAVEDESLRMAQDKLHQLVAKNLHGQTVTEDVILGYPADVIRAHALTINAELIVVGGVAKDYKYLPKGLSTVLGLLSDAPCPVLAIPKDFGSPWTKARLSVLLSDDLQPQTESAMITGYELSAALGNTDVTHVHVNKLSQADLKTALDSAAAAAHVPMSAINIETVWTGAMQSMDQTIAARGAGRRHLVEARGGTVKTSVLQGDPATEITQIAEQQKCDLLVFGRHKTWRQKPFAIGQMPFHSMLNCGRPLLVAGSNE